MISFFTVLFLSISKLSRYSRAYIIVSAFKIRSDLPETVPYAYGFLYLPALLVISSTSVLMAPIGARTAHAMDVSQLKRTFACLLFLIAGYMLYKGLTA